MEVNLRYGPAGHVRLELDPARLVAFCPAPAGGSAEVAGLVARALAAPVAMEPLARMLTAGDRVALALDAPADALLPVVRAVLAALAADGVAADAVTCVSGDASIAASPPEIAARWHCHDPRDRQQLACLGNTAAGEAVYLSRPLLDADVLLPIAVVRRSAERGAGPLGSSLYPRFTDAAAQQRLGQERSGKASPRRTGKPAGRSAPGGEAAEVGQMVGVYFAVYVVPGEGGPLAIVAGEPAAASREAAAVFDAAWRREIDSPANLVIGSLTGRANGQTWPAAAAAWSRLSRLAAEGGAVALCTDLAGPDDLLRVLGELHAGDDPESFLATLPPDDRAAAAVMARLRDRRDLYLLSRLPETAVESAGLFPLANGQELQRLAARRGAVIVVEAAQTADVVPRPAA